VSFEASKLAAGMVILSPYIPLLFMGEEWGERAPFQYFTSHSDPALIEAVRRGRRDEFAAFRWKGEPPDPQDGKTFSRSKLDHSLMQSEPHRTLQEFYRELVKLRKSLQAFNQLSKEQMEVHVFEKEKALQIRRWYEGDEALIAGNFSDEPRSVLMAAPGGNWRKRLDTADRRWGGPGSTVPSTLTSNGETHLNLYPKSLIVFQRAG
jgi:maltooligosyltrehalose trehalohydrolase